MDKYLKYNGLKPIIAIMSGESSLRAQLAHYGEDNPNKCYPFLKTGWTDKDIWKYAEINNIRFAECYYPQIINGLLVEPLLRTGCSFCSFGAHLSDKDRFKRLAIIAPKKTNAILNIKNNGVSYKDAITLVAGDIFQ